MGKADFALLALLLAACSRAGGDEAEGQRERISCALGGAVEFVTDCVVERAAAGGVVTFVVRHPDGAFHRFQLSPDGQKLFAADGAQQTQSALKGDRFEVILGDNRYVIPANPPAHASDK